MVSQFSSFMTINMHVILTLLIKQIDDDKFYLIMSLLYNNNSPTTNIIIINWCSTITKTQRNGCWNSIQHMKSLI